MNKLFLKLLKTIKITLASLLSHNVIDSHYNPVNLLNGFSKIYERFLHDSLSNFTDEMLSKFVSPYKKSYSSNHVLLKLIEDWKKSLDEKNIIGVVLMGLFEAFDCILHDILMVFLWMQ